MTKIQTGTYLGFSIKFYISLSTVSIIHFPA